MRSELKDISARKQLICITHLPQIASMAGVHYSVGKRVGGSKTETFIAELDRDARVKEVAMLLSGREVTEAGIKAAKELMK